MAARLPNLLIFLFGMQLLVAFVARDAAATFAWVHIGVLFSTLAYFWVLVFGLPKVSQYSAVCYDRLFSTSILPFLLVVAADFWLAAHACHLPNPVLFIALLFAFSCLTLL